MYSRELLVFNQVVKGKDKLCGFECFLSLSYGKVIPSVFDTYGELFFSGVLKVMTRL